MATSLQTIRRLTVEGKSSGVKELTQDLDALSRAQTKVEQTASGMAVSTETSAKRQLSAAGAYQRLLMSIDENVRSQSMFSKGQQTIERALRQGVIDAEEHASAMEKLRAKYGTVASANDNMAKSTGLARHELINLSRQMQDVGVSLAGGQSPFTVLAQQGSQIADIFSSSKSGTVGGAIKQIGSGIAGMITPMRALGLGVAAVGVAGYAAYESWKSFTLQLDDAAKAAGTTTGSMSRLQAAASVRGIDAQSFQQGIGAFARSVYEAQHGMGNLAELMRVNGMRAADFDQYLERAADMIQRARGDQERLVLLQQMGLPPTMEWVRLLSGGAEGLRKAKEEMASFEANAEMVERARRFDEAWNRAWTNFGRNARSAIQEALDYLQTLYDRMDRAAKRFGNSSFWDYFKPTDEQAKAAGLTLLSSFEQRFGGDGSNPARNNLALQRGLEQRATGLRDGSTVNPAVERNDIQLFQQRISLLGQLATVDEQVLAVEKQIRLAQMSGVTISDKEAKAISDVTRANIEMNRVNQQASIGVFDLAKAQKAANDNLQVMISHRLLDPSNPAQYAAATIAAQKAVERLADTAAMAGAPLEGLKRLELESGNLRGLLDTTAVSSLNSMTSSLTDIATGSVRAADGFRNMGSAITRAITEMIIKMTIMAPIARALQGLLGGFLPGTGSYATDGIGGYGPTVPGRASGGLITGPGTGTSDSILARLSNGEFVVNAAATAQHLPLLQAINDNTSRLPRFAAGGLAGGGGGGFGKPVNNFYIQGAQSQPQIEAKPNRSGGQDIQIVFRDMVKGVIADDFAQNGPLSRQMGRRMSGFNGS